MKGSLKDIRPDDLTVQMVAAALAKVPELDSTDIDDLLLGLPGGMQGNNFARIVAVLLGYDSLPGTTITRYCSSSLQTTRMALHAIKAGEGDVFISAGVESVSNSAHGSSDSLPQSHNPVFADAEARTKKALSGVHLVISDAHAGLNAAVAQQFTGASLQRCRVHAKRHLGGVVETGAAGHGGDQDDLRAHRTGSSCIAIGSSCRHAQRIVPESVGDDGGREGGCAGVSVVPEVALAEDLVEQSDRAAEQGDQTPRRCRGDLPEPRGVPEVGDRGGDRNARRVASHPPLSLRRVHGRTEGRHRQEGTRLRYGNRHHHRVVDTSTRKRITYKTTR